MGSRRESRPGLQRSTLGLRGAIVGLSVGVLLPVILATTVGIIALVIGTSTKELLIGILVVCFTASAAGGAVVSVVLLGRRSRLARLQSDLLANVSHELRTPLAGIRIHAQTLQSGLPEKDPERTRQSLATIVRETERLEATVERVLTWRSLAPGQGRRRPRPPQPPRQRLQVPGRIETDQGCRPGRGRPRRHHRRGQRDGIPAADLERVFEPFHRVYFRARGGAAGAGLGLAIVRQVVLLHGGEVRAARRRSSSSSPSVTSATGLPREDPTGSRP